MCVPKPVLKSLSRLESQGDVTELSFLSLHCLSVLARWVLTSQGRHLQAVSPACSLSLLPSAWSSLTALKSSDWP